MKNCNNSFLIGLAIGLLFIVLVPMSYFYFNSFEDSINNQSNEMNNTDFRQEFLTDVGVSFGNSKAKVVIEEFFSVSCGACQKFHPVIDKIKQEYVDKGLVKLVKFDFPIDMLSMRASVIARSSKNKDLYLSFLDYLMENPHEWMTFDDADTKLHKIATKIFGFDDTAINKKQKLYSDMSNYIHDMKDTFIGNKIITGLPSIFINGKMYNGPRDYKSLQKEIDRLLKEKK